MSLLIISLLVVGATLVGVKVYFQEKQAVENEEQEVVDLSPADTVKTNEEIVADRLAEIAEFEKEVEVIEDNKKRVVSAAPVANKPKSSKPNQKKSYRPKKQQPKIKAK